MNIFIVEDTVSIRRLLVRRLASINGMRVVGEASDQRQAAALIEWTKPDVVLTDLSLTTGSGLALISELRKAGYQGHIAVLTSQDLDAYRQACFNAGADTFYDKASGLETLFGDLVDLAPAQIAGTDTRPADLLRQGLTELCDAAPLFEQLDRAARAASRDGREIAVYVMRLHGLDQFTGEVGQALTQLAADRLQALSSSEDIVARSAADQFAYVLTQVQDGGQAASHAQRLALAMSDPFLSQGNSYEIEVDMGMALFPVDAIAPRSLLTLAQASAFGAL